MNRARQEAGQPVGAGVNPQALELLVAGLVAQAIAHGFDTANIAPALMRGAARIVFMKGSALGNTRAELRALFLECAASVFDAISAQPLTDAERQRLVPQ